MVTAVPGMGLTGWNPGCKQITRVDRAHFDDQKSVLGFALRALVAKMVAVFVVEKAARANLYASSNRNVADSSITLCLNDGASPLHRV
jgi:hypothetical protein